MTDKTPSYLYIRNGIYYFQMRIPVNLNIDNRAPSTHIRRSTKTRDRKRALILARQWWVDIMSNSDKNEEKGRRMDLLYRRGRILTEKLDKADLLDGLEIDEILDNELGAGEYSFDFDKEALDFYYNANISVKAKVPAGFNDEELAKSRKKLSELLAQYQKIRNSKIENIKTRDKYASQLNLFLEMIGDQDAANLDVDTVINDFCLKIRDLPRNIGSSCKYKKRDGTRLPVDNIIELAKKNKEEQMSDTTVHGYVNRAKSFLVWCEKRGDVPRAVLTAFDELKKPSSKDKINVLPFTDDDLIRIFDTPIFRTKKHFRKLTFRYWGILLAVYTGARLGEICQLHIDDFKYSTDARCWYLSIVETGDDQRRLKNSNAAREIPIHPDLIYLGLKDYIDRLKSREETQLFPDLSPDKQGYWHRKLGRWFNETYSQDCGVKISATSERQERTSFHSFRHTFINNGKQKQIENRIIQEIVGHDHGSGVTKVYEEEFDMLIKYKAMKKIQFKFDVEAIKRWE